MTGRRIRFLIGLAVFRFGFRRELLVVRRRVYVLAALLAASLLIAIGFLASARGRVPAWSAAVAVLVGLTSIFFGDQVPDPGRTWGILSLFAGTLFALPGREGRRPLFPAA